MSEGELHTAIITLLRAVSPHVQLPVAEDVETLRQHAAYLRWCVGQQENIIDGLRGQLYAHTGNGVPYMRPVQPPANILRDKTNTP